MREMRLASPLAMLSVIGCVAASAVMADEWAQYGNDIKNSRHQAGETTLSVDNVGSLEVAWSIDIPTDVTSTPAVANGNVYFAEWGNGFDRPGYIHKVDEDTGASVWSVALGASTEFDLDFARHTPSVVDGLVIVGNSGGRFGMGPATLVALNNNDGSTVWSTVLDPNPASTVTMSPTIHDGVAYVGVASFEEGIAAIFPDPCCTFRGSVVAVDVATGAILWQTYMAPEGYSGNAVWGSSPAVDVARNQLYVATGNNYTAPQSYVDCVASKKNDKARLGCSPGDNYFDSVVALNLATGEVNWATRVLPYDNWNVACAPYLLGFPPGVPAPGAANCPDPAGPDFDFAQGPILYTASGPGMGQGADMIGVGQKSGVYWALRPSNGDILWSTRTGPGGLAGGHQWGSASDGERIYTSNANSFGYAPPPLGPGPYTLDDGTQTQAGIFSALDARTGEIIWQIANPSAPFPEPAGSPAAVANGVMYVCSVGGGGFPNLGQMYAINAATGEVLWTFNSGASCGGGASIANGRVFWGHGYTGLLGTQGHTFYAFGLPD